MSDNIASKRRQYTSTRRIGHALIAIGVLAVVAAILVDSIGLGDQGVGASQLLVMEIGVLAGLLGVSLAFLYPDKQFSLNEGIRTAFRRLPDLPVSVWIAVGFLIVYIAFFIFPVFLNPERSMWYFNKFLPDRRPIGLDIRAAMDYVQGWLASNRSPYADGFIAYPPLALLLFSSMLLIGYPAYYYLITFLSLSFFTVSALLMSRLIERKNNYFFYVLFALSLFSYGFQFELERGQSNVIAFSLCLIAVYLFHLHYESRYAAYLLFTIGVQIKIYPIILIVMFIRDWRDWKANVRRVVGILILNLFLLFILGFRMFVEFLQSVRGQQLYGESWNGNHSLKGFVDNLTLDGFGMFTPETLKLIKQYQGWIEIMLLALLGICLLSIIAHSYVQRIRGLNPNLLLVCTICALTVPSISNDYKLPILTIPMAIVLSSLSMPRGNLRKTVSILLIVITSVAYWSTQYPFTVKPYALTRNFPALFVIMVGVTGLNFVCFERRAAELLKGPGG